MRPIEELLRQTKRQGIEKMTEWLEKSDYYTAPASSRLNYHGCYEGGLAKHSMNVYTLFNDKAKFFGFGLGQDEITIASLFHDLCKVGFYQPNIVKGKISEGKPYVVEDTFPIGHGEKSVVMASRFIELTPTEMLLIRWHMGPYDPSWEMNGEKVQQACPYITAFHCADIEASKYLD